MRREDWLRAEDRKRRALAWAATAGAYLLALGLVLLVEGFRVEEVSDYAGPLRVSLGSPEGNASRGLLEPPPDYSARPPKPAESTPPEPAAAALTSPATPAAPVQPKAPAAAKPAPAASAPAAAKPAPAAPASASAAAASAAAASPAPSASAAPPAPAAPEVARGTEAGNDYETSFGGDSGRIRRSLYVPIYRFMPPPLYLDQDVVDSIAGLPGAKSPMPVEERRKLLLAHYAKSGSVWTLKAPVPLSSRQRLWAVLEDAGFDPRRADYKIGKDLRPVVLSFTVAPAQGQSMPELRDLRVLESSGYGDLDEAVLYGFRQAVFSSSAEKAVTGRFVYRFN